MLPAVLALELEELRVGRVIRLDFGLVADPVRDRADQAHARVLQMVAKSFYPARGDNRVVVEQDQ